MAPGLQIPVLEKGCCGCCSVLTCVKVQSVLNLIGSIWGTYDTIHALVVLKTLPPTYEDGTPREMELQGALLKVTLMVYIVHIVLDAMLVHGVFTSNYRLMRPYLYASAGTLCLMTFVVLLFLVLGSIAGALFASLVLAFGVYCWLHVYSLYVTQKQESRGLNQCAPPTYAEVQKSTGDFETVAVYSPYPAYPAYPAYPYPAAAPADGVVQPPPGYVYPPAGYVQPQPPPGYDFQSATPPPAGFVP